MDSATFLLEREALERRMEEHRAETATLIVERQHGLIPRLLRMGASVLFGFGPKGDSAGWVSSLVWSLAAPALFSVVRQGGDVVVQKIVHSVFPSSSSKAATK